MKSKMDFKEKVSYNLFYGCNISPIFRILIQTGISFWIVTKVVVLVDDLVMKLETMSAQTENLEQFKSEEN